jgi:2-oxoisovalerate dehydrogenase E1 component alpha subunit
MMNQIYLQRRDPFKGRQLPIMYSAKDYGFFTISGNLGTQLPQAVGWAMASGLQGRRQDRARLDRRRHDGRERLPLGPDLRQRLRAPVILCVVNNQWAISSFQGIAGGNETTFASKAIGYGLPGCASTATTSSPSGRRPSGPRSGPAPTSARP